jgi:hypothetical protein
MENSVLRGSTETSWKRKRRNPKTRKEKRAFPEEDRALPTVAIGIANVMIAYVAQKQG